MQKNYYLCKLLCQHINACAQHQKMAKLHPLGVLPTWSAKLQKFIEI